MKQRSPVAVFFLSIITFTIYSLVWSVKTKNEMNRLGANIPTAWLLIVPIVNIYWLWKYSEGVEHVTGGQTSGVLAFVLLFLLGIIGMAIIQNEFNKLAASPSVAAAGATPGQWQPPVQAAMPPPDNSFGGPVPVSPSEQPPAPAGPPSPSV